jgi:oxygen-dependent protoporphyrinogen oxidase
LQKAGKKVLILEKEDKIGGVIQTHELDGFVFESGPNTGALGNPEVVELFEDLKGLCELEIANPRAKSRWIWKKGKWHALPSGPGLAAITTPLFTIKDKFRILGEPFRKKGADEHESVADMVERRLGKSFLQYAVDPFISGIYAGDPEKLITKYALPKLYTLEQNYSSFIKGAVKKRKEPKSERDKKATREVFSAKGGLKNLIDALGRSIDRDKIVLEVQKIKVEKDMPFDITFKGKEGVEHTVQTKRIVTTMGGDILKDIFPFVSEERLNPITSLDYAKVIQVILGYRNWKGKTLDAFGGLVPSIEKRGVLGILFTSSFFDNRCPDNGAILSVFLGGMKRTDTIDKKNEDIIRLALSEVKDMLNVGDSKPDFIKIFKYKNAIPQYGISSKKRLEAIEWIEKKFPGIKLAGNIRDGIGMADRIKQAVNISKEIIDEES